MQDVARIVVLDITVYNAEFGSSLYGRTWSFNKQAMKWSIVESQSQQ